jgi:hypothetical protein
MGLLWLIYRQRRRFGLGGFVRGLGKSLFLILGLVVLKGICSWEVKGDQVLTIVCLQVVIHPTRCTFNTRLPHQDALQYCGLICVRCFADGSDRLSEGAG